MDRVGLGRALGFGARQAAKTLMKAADAVAAPAPAGKATPREPNRPAASPSKPVVTVYSPAPPATARPNRRHAARAPGLRKAVLKPLATYTSVLWLEATGAFFGIFAVVLGTAAWRQRAALQPLLHGQQGTGDSRLFLLYALACAVFVYFAISNFVRAKRRERR